MSKNRDIYLITATVQHTMESMRYWRFYIMYLSRQIQGLSTTELCFLGVVAGNLVRSATQAKHVQGWFKVGKT